MNTWETFHLTLVFERRHPSAKSSGDQKNSPAPSCKEFTSPASAKVQIQEKVNHSVKAETSVQDVSQVDVHLQNGWLRESVPTRVDSRGRWPELQS